MRLDEEDKQWFREELGTVKADFKNELGTVRVDFRGELETIKSEFRSELGTIRAEFRSELEQVEHRFRVGLEHMETTLLTEFHKWASPVEMHQRSHAAVLRALNTEVEAISERVTSWNSADWPPPVLHGNRN